MNWEKAKNFCLFFLLLLNIFLFTAINVSGNIYKLDCKDKQAILNLLEENNIKFNSDIRNFLPKRDISLMDYKFNLDDLKKIFLSCGFEKINLNVYDSDGFECEFCLENKLDIKEIKKVCNVIVAKINSLVGANFIICGENNFYLDYCDEYKTYILSDNFLKFYIKNNGLLKLKCNYKKILGFTGNKYEIYSPDLVLYDSIKSDDVIKNDLKVINKFDLVYKIKKFGDSKFAEPVYRVIYNSKFEKCIDAYIK